MPTFRQTFALIRASVKTVHNVFHTPSLQEEGTEFDRWCDAVVTHATKAAARIRSEAQMDI